jgi:DNA repair exonuclease SbcCD ATPase subunit
VSAIGPWWRRLLRRKDAVDTNPRSAVLQAIAHTREQQVRVSAEVAAVFVKRVSIERALQDQHAVLIDAADQIGQAMAIAQRAAAGARVDEGADARPFELTAQGLQTQLDAVQASIAQLEQLRAGAQANVTTAQQMLRENASSLDRALRAEVRLLGRLERLERQRVIAEAIRRRRDPGSTGPVGS